MGVFVIEGWELRPVCGVVDGTTLKRIEVAPVIVPIEQWNAFKSGGDEAALQGVRDTIESASALDAGDS